MEIPDVTTGQAGKILQETLLPVHALDPIIIRFIGNYLHCRDVKQASRLSGITNSDGRELLNRPDIYKAISRCTEEAVVKFGYDAAEVVEKVKEIAFVDVGELFDDEGVLIENIKSIPESVRRAIKKFKYKSYFEPDINGVPQYRGRVYDVEFHEKVKSLELLSREKDTFKKTTVVEHDVSKNAREWLLASVKRADEAIQAIDVTPREQIANTSTQTQIDTVAGFTKPPGVE